MNARSDVLGLCLLAIASLASAGSASVVFVDPGKHTDASYSHSFSASSGDRAQVQRDIEHHLKYLAERDLPAGDVLTVEVLDIDLAGRFEPSASGFDVRIVREITSPRIELRYKLMHGDQLLGSAEEHLADLSFLMRINPYRRDDRLRYEKAMLDDWFQRRFGIR
ncbi:hypothetical protein GCM10027034_37560 [Ramlibacter solisilvae]|uniref:DUF3016 domain-containing protein n=1 Tax=Ramlibacter tataouinensis TaxID=94132 RepID=A0A127JUX3_9BURK|nr:DUF3016 domain-containing protein [Ramlibacter tataouinensis]AMO23669.1 hypothetical protein UC35_13245 [Ramlibacter tataouinensis]